MQYISRAKSAATNTIECTTIDNRDICDGCNRAVEEGEEGVLCNICSFWFHKHCQNITAELYTELQDSDMEWKCSKCQKEEAAPIYKR